MSRSIFLDALTRRPGTGPASGPGTSIVSLELMDAVSAPFPEAHQDVTLMTRLAEAGHTRYGFDLVMPLFSVCHESAAIGCPVDWGSRTIMPRISAALWRTDEDVVVPKGFLLEDAAQVPLEAISALKRSLGADAAVCGKVFGPWTLGYHAFGIEHWLMSTLDDPDMIKRAIEKMIPITVSFARAQIEAGADCLLLGDHATRDLCSPEAYRSFLAEVHAELVDAIDCPLILHICGDTSDRIGMIAETGVQCFHWDTKLGSAEDARRLAGERLSLMGGVNNPTLLRSGSVEDVVHVCEQAVGMVDIVAPECAVPLDTPMRNLEAIGDFVRRVRSGA